MLFRKSNKAAKAQAAPAPIGNTPEAAPVLESKASKKADKKAAKKAKLEAKKALKAQKKAEAAPHRKPEADFYTVLLALALLAMIVAIVFVCLEMNIYEYKFKGAPTAMMPIHDQIALWKTSLASALL